MMWAWTFLRVRCTGTRAWQQPLQAAPAILCFVAALSSLPASSRAETAPQLRLEVGQHAAPIRRLALDESGELLLTAGDDKTARIWRVGTRELLQVLRPPIGDGWEGRLYGASFSPNNTTIAVAGDTGAGFGGKNRIYLFDRSSGRLERTLDAGAGAIKRIAWSSDGSFVAACSAKPAEAFVFDMRDKGKRLGSAALLGDCYGLAFGSDNQLAVTQFGHRLGIYDTARNGLRLLAQTDELSGTLPTSVAFAPNQSLLAVGYFDPQAPVDVFAAPKDGQIKKLASLNGRDIDHGSLGNVAWSKSGQWLYAAGNGYRGRNVFIVRRWHTQNWKSADFPAATNSITDLVPTPDDGVIFGGFEGNWSILNGAGELHRGESGIADLRGAQALKISRDGMVVQWNYRDGGPPSHFDVRRRVIQAGAGTDLQGAETSRFGIDVSGWENTFQPQFGRTPIRLDDAEVSRSLAILPDKQGFVLGADRSLRRYDYQGRPLWQIAVPGEARAVVATADGERFVVACTDGSLRWYRSRDGVLLLSLWPHPDGVRWVLWQPDGYYDISPGADRLIGWHVNNGTDAAGDFYPIAKFRQMFHRPDVLDHYLAVWDIAAAHQQADAAIAAQSLKPPPPPPPSVIQALPPVVDLISPAEVRTGSDKLTLQFKVRSQADAPAQQVKVRVAGIDVDVGAQIDSAKLGGGAPISVTIPLPAHPAIVLVLAANKHGYSTAAAVRVERETPVAAAAPVVKPPDTPAVAAVAPAAPTAGAAPKPPSSAPIRPQSPPPVQRAEAAAPKLFILAVGVSKYANSSYDLDLPAKDALDFYNVVLQQRRSKLYRDVEAHVLTDKSATRANILDGLEWLKKNVTPDDMAILFLAGHGYSRPDRSYFFIAHDADVDHLEQTAVSNEQITNLITSIKGQRLFFIDTCHAGNALGGARFSTEISHMVSDLTSEENAVIVFSSSTGKQFSLEKTEWGNGAFTKVLVQGIQGAADFKGTGKITQKGLDFYLSDEVSRLTEGQQTPLTIIPFGTPDFVVFEHLNKAEKKHF